MDNISSRIEGNSGFSSDIPRLAALRRQPAGRSLVGWLRQANSHVGGPRDLRAKDWHDILTHLPVWKGWRVDITDGSLHQASQNVFEPNPRLKIPDFEAIHGSGERKLWRVESKFDHTVSDNGFQHWNAQAAFEPYIWKLKLLRASTSHSTENTLRHTDSIGAQYEGFIIKSMYPKTRINLISMSEKHKFIRLSPECKVHLEYLHCIGDEEDLTSKRELLWEFLHHYGEWFPPTVVIGGHLSRYHAATTITGKTMDEKEKEVMTELSAGAAFLLLSIPFGSRNTHNETENMSMRIDRSSITAVGGRQRFSTIAEWEESLDNPRTWQVIERGRPQKIFDLVSQLPGWKWVNGSVDIIASSTPILQPPTSVHRSRHYSIDSCVASIRLGESTTSCIFFQNDDGWIKCGLYNHAMDSEVIVAEPITQAQRHTSIAAWSWGAQERSIKLFGHVARSKVEVHVVQIFFVNQSGILVDMAAEISEGPPFYIGAWCSGILQEQGLKINPQSAIRASRVRGSWLEEDDEETGIVIFEMDATISQSHIFEVISKDGKEWKLIRRPNGQIESVRRGPLAVRYNNAISYSIYYHSRTADSLMEIKAPLDTKQKSETIEMLPLSKLPPESAINRDLLRTTIQFGMSRYSQEEYIASCNIDYTIDIIYWDVDPDAGRVYRIIRNVCRIRPQTDFYIEHSIGGRVLLWYISPSGQMEMVIIKLTDRDGIVQAIPPRPVFQDWCARCFTTTEDGSDDDIIDDES